MATLGICYNSFYIFKNCTETQTGPLLFPRSPLLEEAKEENFDAATIAEEYLSNGYTITVEREAQMCFIFSVSIIVPPQQKDFEPWKTLGTK